MKPLLFLLPGHSERGTGKQYKPIIALLRRRYTVKHVRMAWPTKNLQRYRRAVVRAVRAERKPVSLFGFSYGAATALLASADIAVDRVICCSLSPVFAEDQKAAWKNLLQYMKKHQPALTQAQIRKMWGERDLAYSKTLYAKNIVEELQGNNYLFLMGAKERREFPPMANRARWFARKTKGTFVLVPVAGHEVAHPKYIAALKKNV